jgi:hypothetical protein
MGFDDIEFRLLVYVSYPIFSLQATHKGRYLLDYVCEQLNLAERDYFGLRYVDAAKQKVIKKNIHVLRVEYYSYIIALIINIVFSFSFSTGWIRWS